MLSLHTPADSGAVMIPASFVRIDIYFPPEYPEIPPVFEMQNSLLSMTNRTLIIKRLTKIAIDFSTKSDKCLEACVRWLLGSDSSLQPNGVGDPRLQFDIGFVKEVGVADDQSLSTTSSSDLEFDGGDLRQYRYKPNFNQSTLVGTTGYSIPLCSFESKRYNIPFPCLTFAVFSPNGALTCCFNPMPKPMEVKFSAFSVNTKLSRSTMQSQTFTCHPKTFGTYEQFREYLLREYPAPSPHKPLISGGANNGKKIDFYWEKEEDDDDDDSVSEFHNTSKIWGLQSLLTRKGKNTRGPLSNFLVKYSLRKNGHGIETHKASIESIDFKLSQPKQQDLLNIRIRRQSSSSAASTNISDADCWADDKTTNVKNLNVFSEWSRRDYSITKPLANNDSVSFDPGNPSCKDESFEGPSIRIIDSEYYLPISFEHSQKLTLKGSVSEICRVNKNVSSEFGRLDLHQIWTFAEILVNCKQTHVMYQPMVKSLLLHLEATGDFETLASLIGVFICSDMQHEPVFGNPKVIECGDGVLHFKLLGSLDFPGGNDSFYNLPTPHILDPDLRITYLSCVYRYADYLHQMNMNEKRVNLLRLINNSQGSDLPWREYGRLSGLKCGICGGICDGLCVACIDCRHGGHLHCFSKWTDPKCATGCGCTCRYQP